jgi:signal transduction histidine kinase
MKLNVLVVDDDATDREAIRRYLCRSDRDIIVHEAESGEEAFARLASGQKFNCIFLDHRLDDMDGVSILRRIYDPETGQAPAPVVMLTGQGKEAVMIDALHLGAQDYLVKNILSADTLHIALLKAMEVFELQRSRNEAEDRLRRAQKMEAVGQLTSGVAQDFSNLLTVILANAHLLHKRAVESGVPEAMIKKIQTMEAAASKGVDLIDRLMVFARRPALEPRATDVNICIRGVHELIRRTLGDRIEIKMFLAPNLWPVYIDAGQLQNALINMATNALEAMPHGGCLKIETCNKELSADQASQWSLSAGAYVVMTISDTGIGISQRALPQIFEPFFTTKKTEEKMGLGLSMVYSFARQAGGYIDAESEEGSGTIFRIFLPRHELGIPDIPPSAAPLGNERRQSSPML